MPGLPVGLIKTFPSAVAITVRAPFKTRWQRCSTANARAIATRSALTSAVLLPMSRAISPGWGVSTGATLAWRNRPISSAKLLSPSASITQGRSKFLNNQRKLFCVAGVTPIPGPKSNASFRSSKRRQSSSLKRLYFFRSIVAQRLGHHLDQRAGENIIERARRGQRHQSGAACASRRGKRESPRRFCRASRRRLTRWP